MGCFQKLSKTTVLHMFFMVSYQWDVFFAWFPINILSKTTKKQCFFHGFLSISYQKPTKTYAFSWFPINILLETNKTEFQSSSSRPAFQSSKENVIWLKLEPTKASENVKHRSVIRKTSSIRKTGSQGHSSKFRFSLFLLVFHFCLNNP